MSKVAVEDLDVYEILKLPDDCTIPDVSIKCVFIL